MSFAVRVDQLSKKYGDLPALKSLCFKVKAGDCVGLLGPNGAGKSTTQRILMGQLQADSGQVEIFGKNPSTDPKAVHNLIGYVPDNPALYKEISVEENLEVFRRIYRQPASCVQQILEKMELTDKAKTRVKGLSKGLTQKLLLARALIHTPKALFLDEPTVALDPQAVDFICNILEELKSSGVTLFLSTHLMSLAERLCDQVFFLNKGEKIEEGTVPELKRKYGSSQLELQFTKQGVLKTAVYSLEGNWLDSLAQIQKEGEIVSIKTKTARLEDIFIRLVNRKN